MCCREEASGSDYRCRDKPQNVKLPSLNSPPAVGVSSDIYDRSDRSDLSLSLDDRDIDLDCETVW